MTRSQTASFHLFFRRKNPCMSWATVKVCPCFFSQETCHGHERRSCHRSWPLQRVFCWYNPETHAAEYRTVRTSPAELRQALIQRPVSGVVFEGVRDARGLTASWRDASNTQRPHISLGYRTPAGFAAACAADASAKASAPVAHAGCLGQPGQTPQSNLSVPNHPRVALARTLAISGSRPRDYPRRPMYRESAALLMEP